LKLFPAIDLVGGEAVRLVRGDYAQMTVYDPNPLDTARAFQAQGAQFLHVVDLEGARDGGTPNFETVLHLILDTRLAVEVGGGVRSRAAVARYLGAGALRVILGTAAVADPAFLREMLRDFGAKIAVGVDIRDGRVATHGWTEISDRPAFEFCRELEDLGARTIICTDISKDGVLGGTNLELYEKLSGALSLDIVASGGVSTIDDVRALRSIGLYGAILGKALYTGGLNLADALKICEEGG
jgi:phosphoribosylformimino-5-aminoimidazole carboxamide ribotide isomerase